MKRLLRRVFRYLFADREMIGCSSHFVIKNKWLGIFPIKPRTKIVVTPIYKEEL